MYNDNHRKLAVVLNKRHPLPKLLNGAFHAVAGLVHQVRSEEMEFLVYTNDGATVESQISRFPNIVLTARNGGQLLRLYQAARSNGIAANLFAASMLASSAEEQIMQTRDATPETLEPMAVALFGETEHLDPHTKRFSLLRTAE